MFPSGDGSGEWVRFDFAHFLLLHRDMTMMQLKMAVIKPPVNDPRIRPSIANHRGPTLNFGFPFKYAYGSANMNQPTATGNATAKNTQIDFRPKLIVLLKPNDRDPSTAGQETRSAKADRPGLSAGAPWNCWTYPLPRIIFEMHHINVINIQSPMSGIFSTNITIPQITHSTNGTASQISNSLVSRLEKSGKQRLSVTDKR